MTESETLVHLLRHGEVNNPRGVLYGRMPGFHLSANGRAMADQIAERIGDRPLAHVRISPLERTRETAAPLLALRGLEPVVDPRVIESTNLFEGHRFGGGDNALKDPRTWRHLWNPFRPSWGEPYQQVAGRMLAAVHDARDAARDSEQVESDRANEALIVSHQLPIWTLRLFVEGRSFLHDPRKRQCTLCSLTTLHFRGDTLTQVSYSEPVADLIPAGDKSAPFSSGGGADPAEGTS